MMLVNKGFKSAFPAQILIMKILETYFLNSCIIAVTDDDDNDLHINSQHNAVINVQQNHENFSNVVLKSVDLRCSDFLLKVKTPSLVLDRIDHTLRMATARKGNRSFIFVGADFNDENTFRDVIKKRVLEYYPNILFIVPISASNETCTSFKLLTQKFGLKNLNSDFKFIDEWNGCLQKYEFGNNLFPNNFTNLEGKVLKVATFTYKPYVFVDLPDGSNDGMEIRLIKELCRWINCTIEIVSDDGEEWGEIYDNNTGIGALGKVATDDADMAIAAMYMWHHEYLFLDLSDTVQRTGITCMAPAPKLITGWLLLLLPLSKYLWISFAVVFLTIAITLLIIVRDDCIALVIYHFGMMVAQPFAEKFITRKTKRILIWALLLTFIFINTYGSGLTSSFTVPKFGKSIDTVEDLVDSNVQWGATHEAWIYSILLSTEPRMVHLVNQFHVLGPEELRSRATKGKIALSIERLPGGYFALGDYITEDSLQNLQLMQEDIYWEQTVVMARKHSPYIEKLNILIGRLHNAGILYSWENQVALKHLDLHVQLGVKRSKADKRHALIEDLKLEQLQGAFILLGLGVTLSALAVVMEITYFQLNILHYYL